MNFRMTEIAKQKANTWGNHAYRGFLTLGMATLLFNLGVYKKDLDGRTHKSSQELFEHMEQTKDNTNHRLSQSVHFPAEELDQTYVTKKEYNEVISELIESVARIEKNQLLLMKNQ